MINDHQDLKSQAENLRKQKQFAQAIPIYEKLWEQRGDTPDKWIGWGYAQCLRKLGRPAEALEICREVYRIDPTFDMNNDLYGWCVYDMGIKQQKDGFDEGRFLQAAEAITQLTTHGDFSPYEKAVFAVVHRLEDERKKIEDNKQLSSAEFKQRRNLNESILQWLDHLDVALLSLQSDKKQDGSTFVSPREDWYNSRAKTLLALDRHAECTEICAKALAEIKTPHFGYDVWFRWYGAQSHIALGEYSKALIYLEYILQQKQDFWIRRAYAKCLKELGQVDEAIEQCAVIALSPKGLGFRWEVFLDLGNMLAETGDIENARLHVLLAAAIRRDEGWEKAPQELQHALRSLDLANTNAPDAKSLHRQLQPFWKSKKPRPKTTHAGTIKLVHSNGKSGIVRAEDGKEHFFGMGNYKGETGAAPGMRVGFNLREGENNRTGAKEMHAVDIVPLE